MVVSLALHVSHWALGLVEKTTVVMAFMAWITTAMITEPYYHRGLERGDLMHRFFRVLCWQALIAFALATAQLVVPRVAR